MQNWRKRFGNWILFLPLLLIIIMGVGILTFTSGSLGILYAPTEILQTPLLVSPVPTLGGTPIARFGAIDPAIIDVIDRAPSNYGQSRIDRFMIQPIGVYLPRTGDTQFELLGETPLPTPLPFPTSPPLPISPVPLLPTMIPTATNTPLPTAARRPAPIAPAQTAPNQVAPQPTTVAVVPAQPTDVPPPQPPTTGGCAPSGLPVEGIFTQQYHRYHTGVDIGVPSNTPVLSTHSGTVTFADWSSIGYGNLVIIQNGEFITYYAHNTSVNVSVGDVVSKWSVIAMSGSTGNSTGPHVHYETRINDIPVDPLTFGSRGYSTC